MGSTGSVSSWEEALLVAAIQYPVPVVNGPEDIQVNVDRICKAVASTKAGYPGLDLIVFPEYSTQGLNTAIWSYDEMLLSLDSPEVGKFKQACKDADVWGVFSIMEKDPEGGHPFNTAIIINNKGEIALHYRKLQPWVPVEPWAPGNLGMPVCDGPKGSKLAVCICHDGMFPELAREAAYKGANVYIRISGSQHRLTISGSLQTELMHGRTSCIQLLLTLQAMITSSTTLVKVLSAITMVMLFSKVREIRGKLLQQSYSLV